MGADGFGGGVVFEGFAVDGVVFGGAVDAVERGGGGVVDEDRWGRCGFGGLPRSCSERDEPCRVEGDRGRDPDLGVGVGAVDLRVEGRGRWAALPGVGWSRWVC